ncbi:helix-turn-helix transcriptional regulator [Saccharopolyspora cebuensis]|uniref:Helix-turn-helix transcriptional regulator n=1 Tax=Saccharopolyspora cebuensis TaxID=418759 RepID=A0ABV4CJN4_9PSEU
MGAELRKAREEQRISVREVGRRLGVDHTFVTRIERGTRTATAEDVAAIAVALGLSTDERERLAALAREADQSDWLRAGTPGIHQELVTLIEYERTASAIIEVAPLLIPGLAQTADFARAVMVDHPIGEREARVGMRTARREILSRRDGPTFEAILMERVLDDAIAPASVMADQLRHLEQLGRLPNVTIRVIPADLGRWTPAHSGQFLMFEFSRASPILHLEHVASASFITAESAIDTYRQVVDTLRETAMSPDQTTKLIAAKITEYEESLP